jgi:hypothetical protein
MWCWESVSQQESLFQGLVQMPFKKLRLGIVAKQDTSLQGLVGMATKIQLLA